MELPNELRYSFPPHINVNRITEHVKLPSGLASPLGETHLFAGEGRLLVLSRNKANDEFSFFETHPESPAKLLHEEWQDILSLKGAKGDKVRIPIPNDQVGPVAFLIKEVSSVQTGDAVIPGAEAMEAPPGPSNVTLPEVATDDAPSLMQGIVAATQAGAWDKAEAWADALKQLSAKFSPEADDLLQVITAIRESRLTEAFLRVELSDLGFFGGKDALLQGVALAFERANEPIWAAAAHMACIEYVDEAALARLFRQLGKDAAQEEHRGWLLAEFEQVRSNLISEQIMKTRTHHLWRELRARLAGRRGGQAMALRELKVLSERFPGTVTVECARLRYLWEGGQRGVFERLLAKCGSDFAEAPMSLVRICRVVESVGAPVSSAAEMFSNLVQRFPQDREIARWVSSLDLAGGSGGGLMLWLGAAAAAAAAVVGALFVF
ncbi:MAG: hypothetical protein AAGD10_11795 [Myxococcota bacterium]